MQQAKPLIRVAYLLYEYFADRPDVYVGGGGSLCTTKRTAMSALRPTATSPSMWTPRASKRWRTSGYGGVGKVPDFALEMASPSTAPNDLGHKRDLYESLEIAEYWRLDPTGGELYGQPITGERLVDGAYEPYEVQIREDGSVRSDSELLGLRFYWDADDGFDILDPETDMTINEAVVEREARLIEQARVAEEQEGRLAERQGRLEEQARADVAEARANAAESEARALRVEIERPAPAAVRPIA